MYRIMRSAIVLILADSIMVNIGVVSTVMESFEANELVPDVVLKAPTGLLTVRYPSGVEVTEGNTLTPTQVKDHPTVSWDASPDGFYTILFLDIDAPSHTDHRFSEWVHWHAGNIVGDQVESGDIIAAYVGSGPPPGTGIHRYVFLVFQQPEKLTFDEPRKDNHTGVGRRGFSTAKFTKKYNLGDPVAGNFFYTEWDDEVPILYKRLGLVWDG